MNTNYLHDFEVFLKSRKMADSTIRSYSSMLRKFLHQHKKSPQNITIKEIQAYLADKSRSEVKQTVGALRILYGDVLNCPKKLHKIRYPKKQKTIPDVLSKDEVQQIIDSIHNVKQKAMIQLAYDCGLRVSEVINLKMSDYDKAFKQFHIRQSKGAKDRIVPVTDRTIDMLNRYYMLYRPVDYLFAGQTRPQYSTSSLQTIIRRAVQQLGIRKRIKFHTLRHSKATHLSNAGVKIQHIAQFLGHSSTKTTEIYLHTANEELNDIIRNAA